MYLISVVLQIILESLPISSSGHAKLLGFVTPEYIDRLAHGPTLLMLLIYFSKEIVSILIDLATRWRIITFWLLLIVMANSVTVFCFALLGSISDSFPLWFGFLLTAIFLLSTYWYKHNRDVAPSYSKLFILGVVQGCARLPGISRLGSTYAVACWLGYTPRAAFRISCALQVPLFAAGFLEGAITVWRHALSFDVTWLGIGAIIIAMIIAYYLLWGIEWLMEHNKLWYLGWYMLIPTLCALI